MSDEIEPTPIGARRFDKAETTAQTTPRDVLVKALAELDAAEEKPDHVIVFFGRDGEGNSSVTRYFQGGKFRHHAQQGMLMEGAWMMRESG